MVSELFYIIPPLAFASINLALMSQALSMKSCIVISVLTHMHCLGSLSRRRPEYHCHFSVILMNVFAVVRIVDLDDFVDF